MKQDFTIWRNQILQNPQNISPLTFGMSQDEIMEVFGKPDAVSTIDLDAEPDYFMGHLVCIEVDCKYKIEVGGFNG